MGDATKLAFAVFLISCSSGGCGGLVRVLLSSAVLIVTPAECKGADSFLLCVELSAMQSR